MKLFSAKEHAPAISRSCVRRFPGTLLRIVAGLCLAVAPAFAAVHEMPSGGVNAHSLGSPAFSPLQIGFEPLLPLAFASMFYCAGGIGPSGDLNVLQLVSSDTTVVGLRLDLPIAFNETVVGLDAGIVCHAENFWGICAGAFSAMEDGNGILVTVFDASPRVNGIQIAGVSKVDTFRGLQVGAVPRAKEVLGIQVGLIDWAPSLTGIQIGLLNIDSLDSNPDYLREVRGIQIGLANTTATLYGVQIGLVNSTETLHGLQLGLVNAVSSSPNRCLPLLRFSF